MFASFLLPWTSGFDLLGFWDGVSAVAAHKLLSGLLVCLLDVTGLRRQIGYFVVNSPVVAGLCALSPGTIVPVWVAAAVWPGRVSLRLHGPAGLFSFKPSVTTIHG